jgi:hypothetical protein
MHWQRLQARLAFGAPGRKFTLDASRLGFNCGAAFGGQVEKRDRTHG